MDVPYTHEMYVFNTCISHFLRTVCTNIQEDVLFFKKKIYCDNILQ